MSEPKKILVGYRKLLGAVLETIGLGFMAYLNTKGLPEGITLAMAGLLSAVLTAYFGVQGKIDHTKAKNGVQ